MKAPFKLLAVVILFPVLANAQLNKQEDLGRITGNFEGIGQYYSYDPDIGTPRVPEKILFNGFSNINYTRGDFRAGVRYETYQNVLLGFSPLYEGSGLTYRYAGYTVGDLDVTIGNFYEQFGNGQILRAYEERSLGLDNAFDGARMKYNTNGVYLTALIGKQRWYFDKGPGIVRAGDAEVNLNELLGSALNGPTRITLGGSVVSKYQEDNNINLTLPENTLAYGGRFLLQHKTLSLSGEYTYKFNDPNADNGYIYQSGEMLSVSASYARKGLGINLSAHTLDNMFFRSDRNNSSQFQDLFINYIPALTKQHTYNLMATLYPYATQPNGEMAFQADIVGRLKRGTWYGGKHGTSINVNYSIATAVERTPVEDVDPDLQGQRTGHRYNLFKPGTDENGDLDQYYGDFNIEVSRKLNKKWKTKVTYQHLVYNQEIIEGKPGVPNVIANVGVIEGLYKINTKNAIRTELQGLFTEQDKGDWATVVIEYTRSPHWFVSVMDQYNYGNSDKEKRLHYPNVNVGYIQGPTRITLGYGRQREGIFCVGGVCRTVPASNGATLSVTTTF
ncbi:DUF6029 family protein [Salibacter halophilus]|uniref:DUF5723 domain-containing protein n=1 Tax=Salibacter halophilus TaxID=1803916 RepID=A0A6N6M5C5_9FLAO|nr:DUF6029 family protein [Salibacter halophilus]KAB1063383.1 hypothetical protein F3059_09955 [Salibacter halophilus]